MDAQPAKNNAKTEAIHDLDKKMAQLGFYHAKNPLFFGSKNPNYIAMMFSARKDDVIDI